MTVTEPPVLAIDVVETLKLELVEATVISDERPVAVTVKVFVTDEPTVVDASQAVGLTEIPVEVPVFMSKQHFVTLSFETVTVFDCVAYPEAETSTV